MWANKIYLVTKKQVDKSVVIFRGIPIRSKIRYGLIAFLVFMTSLTLIAKLNGHSYADAVQKSKQQLQVIQDQINAILPPSEIELGQQDLSVDYLLEQTDPKLNIPKPIDTPSRYMVMVNLFPKTGLPYSSLTRVKYIHREVQNLTDYQYEVFYAIGSVLEYNPRAEFADKTLNEEEIKLRITNARDGITNADKKLQKVSSSTLDDPTKNEVVDIIQSLLKQLEEFSSERDYEAWYTTVDTSQKSILANRQAFWKVQTDQLFVQISEINQNLAILEKYLRN